ncbi:ABC transporter ATP-binding protein [Gemella morbillorum]|nr:ABC transporter ATP-binding protein [Gemella morbillorum]
MANDRLSFEIEEGEFVVILGPSGAGKSTLLNILGGMDSATSGSVNVFGKEIVGLDEKDLTEYRRQDIGFVFQFYNLIPNLSVLENVELANQIVKKSKDALEILKLVGLENRVNNFPSQISGGEQQRVAIARAIAKNPKILLCDEPTGALDYKTGKNILKILKEYCKNEKKTVIVITHNSSIAQTADKVIEIYDAKVKSVFVNQIPKNIDEIEW